MFNQIMSLITSSFQACSVWFTRLWEASGMTGLFLAMIFIGLCYRFLLAPVIGRSAGSDSARKSKVKNNG